MYMLAEFFFFFAVALVLGALVFAVVATVFIVKEGCALAIRATRGNWNWVREAPTGLLRLRHLRHVN